MVWFRLALITAMCSCAFVSPAVRAQPDAGQDTHLPAARGDPTIVRVRLASELGDEAAAIASIFSHDPNWKIEEPADYEILHDPQFFKDFVLVPVKREGRAVPPAFSEQLNRDGPMDARAILDFYEEPYNEQYAWASNVPHPIYLGSLDEDEFENRLNSITAAIAKRHRLLAMESGPERRTTSVCVSQERPPTGYCGYRNSEGLLEIPRGVPATITVKQEWKLDRNVYVLAVAPDESISLLFSSEPDGAPASVEPGYQAVAYVDNGDNPGRFDQLGLYRIVTIASELRVNPALFGLAAGASIPAHWCENALEKKLCAIFTLARDEQSNYFDIGDTDVAVTDVFSTEPIWPTGYVVNGFGVNREDALWQVQLFRPVRGPPEGISGPQTGNANRLNFEKAHHCGGSYIGDGFIVTAAHCVNKEPLGNAKPDLFVRMGTTNIVSGGATFGIDSIMIHNGYKKPDDYDDIALIRIDPGQMAAVNNLVKQGALSSISLQSGEVREGTDLLVTGWGFMGRAETNSLIDMQGNTQRSPRYLQGALLKDQPASSCSKIGAYSGFKLDKIVCANSPGKLQDACYKDSGGPLTRGSGRNRILVGIVSVGNGCAIEKGASGGYTKVSEYRSWIARAKRKARSGMRVFVH
ncbi:MAG: serine protease [Pontixanthobacter sp.]